MQCTALNTRHWYGTGSTLSAVIMYAPTILFRVRSQNLMTQLSLQLGQSCGIVCQRQFVMCTVSTLHSFKCRLTLHFFSSCFNDWQHNALRVWFCTWGALNSLLLLLLLLLLLQSEFPDGPYSLKTGMTKAIPWWKPRDLSWIRLVTVQACDRRTDRQTDRWTELPRL